MCIRDSFYTWSIISRSSAKYPWKRVLFCRRKLLLEKKRDNLRRSHKTRATTNLSLRGTMNLRRQPSIISAVGDTHFSSFIYRDLYLQCHRPLGLLSSYTFLPLKEIILAGNCDKPLLHVILRDI